jgi:hypothetical protein
MLLALAAAVGADNVTRQVAEQTDADRQYARCASDDGQHGGLHDANDAFMKTLAGDMPLFQLIFLRSILTTFASVRWRWYLGALHLRIPHGTGA